MVKTFLMGLPIVQSIIIEQTNKTLQKEFDKDKLDQLAMRPKLKIGSTMLCGRDNQ